MRLALSHSLSALTLSGLGGAPGRRRIATMALVVALHALLLFMLLRLAPPPFLREVPRGPLVVTFLPNEKASTEKTESKAKQEKKEQRRTETARRAPSPLTRQPAPVASDASIWSKVIPITGDQFAASDIGKMPRHATQPASDGGDAAAGASSAVVGGFNGEALYAADWYRRPTQAELSTYLPRNAPRIGWGMIACRTAKDYRVEDCQEIGQYPPGSGLAGAVRQAAWQFRVLPPRIGGKPQLGVWVRIRIDYTEKNAG